VAGRCEYDNQASDKAGRILTGLAVILGLSRQVHLWHLNCRGFFIHPSPVTIHKRPALCLTPGAISHRGYLCREFITYLQPLLKIYGLISYKFLSLSKRVM
jgi:hypothetical protein